MLRHVMKSPFKGDAIIIYSSLKFNNPSLDGF